jgi:hypothetical protein
MTDDNKGKVRHELATLFDSFYSHFVLRDLFGKITPGAIVLIAMLIIVINSSDFYKFFYSTNVWIWIIFISVSWLIGFAIQGMGEIFHLIIYFPERISKIRWYEEYIIFLKGAEDFEKQNVERFVVIKEACGNGYVAFGIVLIFLLAYGIIFMMANIFNMFGLEKSVLFNLLNVHGIIFLPSTMIFLIVLIIGLRHIHFVAVQNQYDFMCKCKCLWYKK